MRKIDPSTKKRRFLPSLLMISGFILFSLSASAIPSVREDSRNIIIIFAIGSIFLIFVGIILAIFKSRKPRDE